MRSQDEIDKILFRINGILLEQKELLTEMNSRVDKMILKDTHAESSTDEVRKNRS